MTEKQQDGDSDVQQEGPWRRVPGGCWHLYIEADQGAHVYEIEYRRAEPGQQAGYYLFGPRHVPTRGFGDETLRFDGHLLTSQRALMARYEAFAKVMETVAVPSPYEHIRGAS